MQTPDEIKAALKSCAEDDCRKCGYYKAKATCQQDVAADALAYIQRLEAELVTTRKELARQGDPCVLCKYDAETDDCNDCSWVCIKCEVEGCPCRKCWETEAKEGFEWDGGQRNE